MANTEHQSPTTINRLIIFIILGLLFILQVHNVLGFPVNRGFDIAGHIGYVRYLKAFHALPKATDGYEMYQPPLYYFLAGYPKPDPVYLSLTIKFLETTKHRFSQDAGVVSLVAKYEKELGLMDDYNESVRMVAVLRPDLLQWYDSFR